MRSLKMSQKKYTVETTSLNNGVKVIIADDVQYAGPVVHFITKKEKREGSIILQDDKPEIVYTLGVQQLISIEPQEV